MTRRVDRRWPRRASVAACVLVLATWLAAPAAAADPAAAVGNDSAADTVASRKATEQACAAYPQAEPGFQDLKALGERIAKGQNDTADPGLPDACKGWRQVLRDQPADALLLQDWQANVASALVWQGRTAQAEPLLATAYRAYAAAGPAKVAKAGEAAAMLAVIWVQRSDGDTALQWSQRAIDAITVAPEGFSERERLRMRLNHGSLQSRLRQFDAAQATLQGVLDAALTHQPQPYAPEAAAALNNLAMVARRQTQYGAALAYTDRELAMHRLRDEPAPLDIANAMQNRGVLLMQLARYDEAEAALQGALQHAQQAQANGAVDLWGHQASLRETLSGLLRARGRPAEALQVANDAVAALAGQPEAASARGARPLRRVAEAQLALGELGQGVATYRRALTLLPPTPGASDADTAHALRLGYAVALIELGDLAEAEATLQVVNADTRPRTGDEQAQLQTLLATLAQRRGDAAAAAAAWAAADLAWAASVPAEHPSRRLIRAQACEVQPAPCAAEPTGDAAGPPASTSARPPDSPPDSDALLQLSLARQARAQGRASDAESAARAAVAAATASGQPRLQWQALALWADVRADTGQRDQAIFLGKLALSRLQQQRERLLPLGPQADARYLADKTPLYRRVAGWLLDGQRLPEALAVLRLLKRQEQADYNERGLAPAAGDTTLGLNATEQAALQRFEADLPSDSPGAAELRALTERAAAQRITPAERERLLLLQRQEAQQRQARLLGLDAVLAGLRAAAPGHGGGDRRAQPALAQPLQRPPAGQLNVVVLAGEQRLSLLMLGAQRSWLHQLDLPSAELARQVAALRDGLAAGDQRPPQAPSLQVTLGRLVASAAQQSQARQIVVSLDGPLRYLPMGLLHDGRHYLAERYRWVVDGGVSSQRLALVPPTASPSYGKALPQIAAFGVTQALQGLPALPGVAQELCDIVDGPVLGLEADSVGCGTSGAVGASGASSTAGRGHGPLRGQGLLNARFTAAALTRDAAASAPGALLHIGTHFVLRPGSVSKSWLLLGDGERLALDRLRGLPIGAPGLVTLSACETAVQDARGSGGREVDGLAAALLDNGAAQVLASLWRVDDRATARFMQRFYAAYARQGGNAALALQQAQRKAIDEGAPPNDWAAFVLVAQAGGRRTDRKSGGRPGVRP